MKTSNEKHAAVVLKCLPRATADRFLESLDSEACSNIVQLMQHVDVTAEKLKAAIALLEKEGLGESISSGQSGSEREHRSSEAGKKIESPFEFLIKIENPVLMRLFNQEQSRNAATILSMLPKEFASTILRDLAPSKRVEIIRNIVSLVEPDEREIIELRFSLRLRIQKLLNNPETSHSKTSDPSVSNPEISDPEISDQTSAIEEASGNETRTYDTLHELSKLSNQQVKKLLKRVDTSHLAPALKTLPIQLQRKVLRNMASKPAAIVSREIVDVRMDEKHRIERSSRSVARAIKELEK